MSTIIDSGLRTQDSGLRTQDSGLRTNYALLKYSTMNIGDEIQSIAARRFIPHVDEYIDRERLDSFIPPSGDTFTMILNGWYTHSPKNFPPSRYIAPLLVSMHFSREIRSSITKSRASMEWLRNNGPVGCRDKDTMRFLLSNDVPAYFSGCLTLTLQENKNLKTSCGRDYILCVDVPDDVYDAASEMAGKTAIRLTKTVSPYVSCTDKLKLAEIYLYVYHNAATVITSNLHTAMPCLGLNTPVCLITQEKEDGRFDGLSELVNHCTRNEFMRGCYDVSNPPENPKGFAGLRGKLIETCRDFTGYDAGTPTLGDSYRPDVVAMLGMLGLNHEGGKRALFTSGCRNLLKAFVVKEWHKFFPPAEKSATAYEVVFCDKYLD